MTWTTDRPTAPGWYWYRLNSDYRETVVYAYGLIDGGPVEVVFDGRDSAAMPKVGQWAGPITPPEEQ